MDYNVYLVGIKGVTSADKKFIERLVPNFNESKTVAVNPFSRERFETNPLVANLVTFIQDLEYSEFSAEYLRGIIYQQVRGFRLLIVLECWF